MKNKVLLILVDGMRPDAIAQCGNDYLLRLAQKGSADLKAQTVMPSVTLPCHASLFLSVDPERHGITTNQWMPQVRPIESLIDVVAKNGGTTASLYNWEQLRDLSAPGSLNFSLFQSMSAFGLESDRNLTQQAISLIKEKQPDFLFLYLGVTDEQGHSHGWLSPEYLAAIKNASSCIEQVVGSLPENYTVVVTADHGGHQRTHGTDSPEDMTIPVIFYGNHVKAGVTLNNISIKDIAPTALAVLGLQPPKEWEGTCCLQE